MRGKAAQVLVASLIAVGVALVIHESGVFKGSLVQTDDYIEYWAAGSLNIARENPYDPQQLLRLQTGIGRVEGVPVPMWNPPYALSLVMPFALLPYDFGRILWFFVSLACVGLGTVWLWDSFSGSPDRRWLALVLGFVFYPTVMMLQGGQISGFMLFGLAGFLRFHRSRELVAGAFAALLALKPHLVYLFWFALVADSCVRRRWRLLLSLSGTLLVTTAVAALANPSVVLQYYEASMGHPPLMFSTPTLGGFLRTVFGYEKTYLQFLPVALGVAWLSWRWVSRSWDWVEVTPMLTLVSVVTAVYGWTFDKVVTVVGPLAVAAARPYAVASPRRLTDWAYLAMTAATFCLAGGSDHLYAWLGPCLLAWYLWAQADSPLARRPTTLGEQQELAVPLDREVGSCSTSGRDSS